MAMLAPLLPPELSNTTPLVHPRILLLDILIPSFETEDVLNHMASTVVLMIVLPLTVVSFEPFRHIPPFGRVLFSVSGPCLTMRLSEIKLPDHKLA